MESASLELAPIRGPAQIAVKPPTAQHDHAQQAYLGQQHFSPVLNSIFDGSKFAGGFGPTQLQFVDYWTLRLRSEQLFNENLYARGLIRRLITNEVNQGLHPECVPAESLTGQSEDEAAAWSEDVEQRFLLWGKNPRVCDWKRSRTWGQLTREMRQEALVAGDVLVVLRTSRITGTPQVQLIRGSNVQSPLGGDSTVRRGHTVRHGVEFDAQERQVAYWVKQKDGGIARLPAFGEKSGRRIAWLVYGTDKRLDDVRGQPLLALVMQSLKEIDRYRDSAQRKAVVNSFLAIFVQKDEDKAGTKPFTGGAVRKNTVNVDADSSAVSGARSFDVTNHVPGIVMEELQTGEKPMAFNNQGIDVRFGEFEEAIIQAVAWANEIPPEVMRLSFSSNYSASQAANSEFRIYLDRRWSEIGEDFCSPIHSEWLISEVLNQKISAPGLLEAWRDPLRQDVFMAWTLTEWYGNVKLSVDTLKQAKGSQILVKEGWSTNAREARVLNGSKFSQNIKRVARENQQKAEAARPLLELQQEFGGVDNSEIIEAVADRTLYAVEDHLQTGER